MDYLIRGLARNNKIRIIACDCKDSVNLICKKHETYPVASIALGRFLCASTMMGAMLKDDQTITLVINANGELGTLFAQSNALGNLRGFVSNPFVDLPLLDGKWDVEKAVGNEGVLTVIKSFDEKNSFSSQVEIKSGDIASDVAFYFFESEQLPTIINVSAELDKDGNISSCKGYIIQLMTGYDDSDVEFLEKINLEALNNKVDDVVLKMFPDFEKLSCSSVQFACDCSKEKFEKGLKSLNKNELKQILEEDGKVETMCNFCSEKYVFSKEEIEKIIKE